MHDPRERFLALCARIGRPTADAFDRLAIAYQHPLRAYHNLSHVVACLEEFDRVINECENPDAVEAAIWFHDAIYDPHRPDNEQRSAELAHTHLSGCAATDEFCDRVTALILITRHDHSPQTSDAAIIADVDLAILGKPIDLFDAYEHAIREEYHFVNDADFRAGRTKVLNSFLARPSIYVTQSLRERYEAQARANLRHSVTRLAGSVADA